MSLTLDGIIFSLQRHGGISMYFRELLANLARVDVPVTLTIYNPMLQSVPQSSEMLRIDHRAARHLERYRSARVPDTDTVFHSSYYRLPACSRQASVVTVHDFTYERFGRGPALWIHRRQKKAAIRAAQAIICISTATRDDLLEFVGVKANQTLHVIPNGVACCFRPIEGAEPSPRDLLFVGDRGGYKNFRLLLKALALLPGYRVQCVGGGALRDEEFKGLNSGLRERVTHLGYINNDQLNIQYNQVAGLIYPSAYEGFGIPVVEAMRAGCPVVTTDCRAVREVGGSSLTVAEAMTPPALAEAIRRLDNAAWRGWVIQAGLIRAAEFSWRATHERTLLVYRDLGGLSN